MYTLKKNQFNLIAGPCVIESLEHTLESAEAILRVLKHKNVNFVFKASYDKANRTSIKSFRGPGLDKGLEILAKVKKEFNCPILTDVHSESEAKAAAEVCDILQIPAFLCRQTDLIIAAGKSGAFVNIKKGQFLSPWDMKHVIEKLEAVGCKKILLTERGSSFGYQNLVVDYRSIPVMQSFGYPVFFDATHSVQLPGSQGNHSGGQKEFIPILTKAALAAGVEGIFAEVHPHPTQAKSDAKTQLSIAQFEKQIDIWIKLFEFTLQQELCLEEH